MEASPKLRLGRAGRGQEFERMGQCTGRGDRLCCVRRRFGTKCAGCAQGISPSDLVRKARSKVFHLNCFTCMVCNKQLSTGEELYVIDENKFVCKDDYLSSSSLKEGSLNSGRRPRPAAAGSGTLLFSLALLCPRSACGPGSELSAPSGWVKAHRGAREDSQGSEPAFQDAHTVLLQSKSLFKFALLCPLGIAQLPLS